MTVLKYNIFILKGVFIMRKVTMKELVGKDIRITDFRIEKTMKSKNDKAIVELEINGEYCYFETISPEVLYQLTWIRQCMINHKLNRNAKGIRWAKMLDSVPCDETCYEKIISKGFNSIITTGECNNSVILLADDFCSTDSRDNPYLCFYKNSVYVKVIKQRNSIYFSFSLSKETTDRLIKEETESEKLKTKKKLAKGNLKYKYTDL